MFDVILYTNKSESIVVDKNITIIRTVNGEQNEETSIVTPSIVVEADVSDIMKCNYCYIPTFGRYYYVGSPVSTVNGLWRLDCHCDVLMSWKNDFRKLSAIVAKNEHEYNLLLNDGSLKSYSDPHVLTKTFPAGFGNQYNLVLTLLG